MMMNVTEFSVVVFDLDGTLVDSAPDLCQALNALLAELGRRSVTLTETRQAVGDGVSRMVERILAITGGVPHDVAPHVQHWLTLYHTIRADKAQIYPGVVATLSRLQAAGRRLGLCTNKPAAATHKLLAELDLAHFFGAVAGGDTYAVHKPDPEHLHGVIRQLGATPVQAVMVGDGINDWLAAKNLGVPFVWACYGYDQSPNVTPGLTLRNMADLPGLLGLDV